MTAPIRSQAELLDAIRARRDELNISHETIDNIAGLQSGYTSKLLAPQPIKNLGPMSMGPLLGALGVALMLIEDDEQIDRVSSRWQKRKRPQKIAALSIAHPVEITDEMRKRLIGEYMRKLGSKGGKMGGSKGGKRRAKMMKKRARQAAATHAARMRWSKKNV